MRLSPLFLMTPFPMRYLGNKTKLLDFIHASLAEYGVAPTSVADLFAGTGAVAHSFAKRPEVVRVVANDVQYYSYVFLKARLGNAVRDLAPLQAAEPVDGFITKNYAVDRLYFSVENGRKIDGIRAMIANDDHYSIACLISAMCVCANTPGIFQTYLKKLHPAALKPIVLKPIPSGCDCEVDVRHADVLAMEHDYAPVDLVYLDPPYNNRKYSTYYHVLETIARNDDPAIGGIGGHRQGESALPPVNFYHRKPCRQAFVTLLSRLPTRHVAISYSTDGILSEAEMAGALFDGGFGDVRIFKRAHRRYNAGTHDVNSVQELLYVATKGAEPVLLNPTPPEEVVLSSNKAVRARALTAGTTLG